MSPALTQVDNQTWREEIGSRMADGARLATLYATSSQQVRCVLILPDGTGAVISTAGSPAVPSIVEAVPGAGWAEREAHDLYGVEFAGHQPMRALVVHPADGWEVPVTGGGVHEVAVGPIHAGVIESGHFRFHVVGERILHLDVSLFHKHRGLERSAEGAGVSDAIAFAHRACALCSVANTVAYAQAAEQVLGLGSTPELARTRTILLELERLYNHLNDLSAISAGSASRPGRWRSRRSRSAPSA